MQCNDCRYYLISPNDYYGVCKRYPENQNKNKTDFCGEFSRKFEPTETKVELAPPTESPVTITFEEQAKVEAQKEGTYDAETGIFKPLKRTRKTKNVN